MRLVKQPVREQYTTLQKELRTHFICPSNRRKAPRRELFENILCSSYWPSIPKQHLSLVRTLTDFTAFSIADSWFIFPQLGTNDLEVILSGAVPTIICWLNWSKAIYQNQ